MGDRSPGGKNLGVEPEILPPSGRPDRRRAADEDEQPGRAAPAPRAVDGVGTHRDTPHAPHTSRQSLYRWATAPATYALVGVNCLVYLAMLLSGVYNNGGPSIQNLLHWGANAGPYVLLGDQWWRLVTAAFVHAGFVHVATNMWCLWNLGLLGEPLLGSFGVVAVYLLTGVAGNLLSIALHPGVPGGPQGVVGIGASGAVFGLAGVLIMLLNSPLLPVPRQELRRLRRSVIFFAIFNFVFGASTLVFRSFIRIDNMAHLGGFLCGLALGLPLVPRIGAPGTLFTFRRRVAYGGMLVLLVAVAFGISSFWLG